MTAKQDQVDAVLKGLNAETAKPANRPALQLARYAGDYVDEAVSPLADFSFDYHDLLFTPVAASASAASSEHGRRREATFPGFAASESGSAHPGRNS